MQPWLHAIRITALHKRHDMNDAQPNYFQLFQLPTRFALDEQALQSAYHQLLRQVHPDRFVLASDAEKKQAQHWSSLVHRAREILLSPSKRASYLCELAGFATATENNTSMPAEFLQQQMTWFEQLEETDQANFAHTQQSILKQIASQSDWLLTQIETSIDQKTDYALASDLVRKLMFLEQLSKRISQKHR